MALCYLYSNTHKRNFCNHDFSRQVRALHESSTFNLNFHPVPFLLGRSASNTTNGNSFPPPPRKRHPPSPVRTHTNATFVTTIFPGRFSQRTPHILLSLMDMIHKARSPNDLEHVCDLTLTLLQHGADPNVDISTMEPMIFHSQSSVFLKKCSSQVSVRVCVFWGVSGCRIGLKF